MWLHKSPELVVALTSVDEDAVVSARAFVAETRHHGGDPRAAGKILLSYTVTLYALASEQVRPVHEHDECKGLMR